MAEEQSRTAQVILGECERLVARLEKMCCEPGRSPSMQHLAETLGEVRTQLEADSRDLDRLVVTLEDAGGQLGRLQIGCCTADRMPLYADTLTRLTEIQLVASADAGVGH